MNRLVTLLCMTLMIFAPSLFRPSTARAVETTCDILQVAEWVGLNVAVYCRNEQTVSGVYFIAVPAHMPHASRFLSLAQMAMLSGKTFYADIPETGSGEFGCRPQDCRIANMFGVRNR